MENNQDNVFEQYAELIKTTLSEMLEVEAMAQAVEFLNFSEKLSQNLQQKFGEISFRVTQVSNMNTTLVREIIDLKIGAFRMQQILDKSKGGSLNEQNQSDREVILEIFPPSQTSLGISVNRNEVTRIKSIDCENRIHVCKAVCCRMFDIPLTPSEISGDQFDWDTRSPYNLTKNRQGCSKIQNADCSCSIYNNRPKVCQNYSCENDRRIWSNFNAMILTDRAKQIIEKTTEDSSENRSSDQIFSIDSDIRSKGDKPQDNNNLHNDVNDNLKDLGSNGVVPPPNFDELRRIIVAEPKNKFTPPPKNS